MINVFKILDAVQKKMSAGASPTEVLLYSKILEKLKDSPIQYAATLTALPSPADSSKELYYVASEGTIFYASSNKSIWIPLKLTNSTSTGIAWTWGSNYNGTLGDGTANNRSSPGTTAGTNIGWASVAASGILLGNSISGIKTDGTLWTWGKNNAGQLGDGSTTSRSSPGTTAGGGTTWRSVDLGTSHSAAIKTDGTLWTWGQNSWGGLGDGTTTGRSSPGTTAGAGTTWSKVSCGGNSTMAIKTDGTLWTWGINGYGQLGDGTTTSRTSPGTTAGAGTTWSSISAGYRVSAAIKTDGTLWTWGQNHVGQLGTGDTTNRSSPGTVAGGGTTWSIIDIGGYSMAGIKTDGTLWTWGDNNSGQLGTGNTTSRSSPGTTISGGTTWRKVSGGTSHMVAIKTDGILWSWGNNSDAQLGTGDTTTRSSPGTVVGGKITWVDVSSGVYSNIAITYY